MSEKEGQFLNHDSRNETQCINKICFLICRRMQLWGRVCCFSLTVTGVQKEAIKTEGSKLCWMRSSLLASLDVIELQITEVESNLTKVI